jgi:PKD repeat protein
MKKIYLIITITLLTINVFSQAGQWTWMNGSNTNTVAVWGTQGSFAPLNTPVGVYEACNWTDLNGKFWMYGGLNSSDTGQYSDLWEFDPAINQWAWIKGPGIPQAMPTYGTQGIPAPANSPGARAYGTTTWVDNNNNLWLFGGWNNGWGGIFADLWMYDISTNEWTWVKGPQGPNSYTGVYGTKGIADTSNNPPARCETNATWTDAANNLWIFGGQTWNKCFNDLWKYNIATNQWTWVSGLNTIGGAGNWGTIGVPDSNNIPSSRMIYSKWKDHLGNFWLWGGYDFDSIGIGAYNDLWRYNPVSNIWTWMSGTDSLNNNGFCFGPCISSIYNCPSGRFENRACYQTGCDQEHFQFYGGGGDLNAISNDNDLWDYDVAHNKWTLMSGSLQQNQPAVYGTKTVSATTNQPAGMMGSIGWTDPLTNSFWLFGGVIIWTGINADHPNTMWRFVPDSTCPHDPHVSVSSFTFDTLSGCAPLSVHFMNTSIGSTNYFWNFGDSNTSTLVNPSHTFDTSGTYTVTLIIYDTTACGIFTDTSTQTLTITVFNPPIPPIITQSGDTLISSFVTGNQWFKDSILISGATNELFIGPSTGCYYVMETDSLGCTSISDTVCFSFAGINEISYNHSMSIYPNPNDGTFELTSQRAIPSSQFEIKDVLGRNLYSYSICNFQGKETFTIPLSNGIYFWEVITDDGIFAKGKLLIQR